MAHSIQRGVQARGRHHAEHHRGNSKLQSFTGLPLLPSDATLTKEAREEINADFTLVRIGKDQTGHGSDHKFMPPARIRAIESKLMQSFYEFAAGNRERRTI